MTTGVTISFKESESQSHFLRIVATLYSSSVSIVARGVPNLTWISIHSHDSTVLEFIILRRLKLEFLAQVLLTRMLEFVTHIFGTQIACLIREHKRFKLIDDSGYDSDSSIHYEDLTAYGRVLDSSSAKVADILRNLFLEIERKEGR